jgi:hypothetical protein
MLPVCGAIPVAMAVHHLPGMRKGTVTPGYAVGFPALGHPPGMLTAKQPLSLSQPHPPYFLGRSRSLLNCVKPLLSALTASVPKGWLFLPVALNLVVVRDLRSPKHA